MHTIQKAFVLAYLEKHAATRDLNIVAARSKIGEGLLYDIVEHKHELTDDVANAIAAVMKKGDL